ncbi:MAG: DNA-directed DNA polymerase II small subunit [archaeon]|nr:DNA-directed DNA polymerase II small subunit [archaeon]
MDKKEVVAAFLDAGILADQSAIDYMVEEEADLHDVIERLSESEKFFVTDKVIDSLLKDDDAGKVKVVQESRKFLAKDIEGSVVINSDMNEDQKTKTLSDFVAYFNDRYEKIKNILMAHGAVRNVVSVTRFVNKTDEKNISVIAIVSDIVVSKNGHMILNIEDPTGTMTAIIMKDKNIGEECLVTDEVIALRGSVSKGTMFVDSIVFPEIPVVNNIEKKVDDAVSGVFISDIHIGSNEYLYKVEDKFIKWIRSGENGASDVKYICIAGDTVDGVGIYPGQKQDLKIPDIYAQYRAFEEFIEKIPEYINIVIIPGNHDAVRLAEPQPAFGKNFLPNISDFKNVYLGPNPCRVNIHSVDGKAGVDVLMYHGYSFTRIIDAIPGLRSKGMDHPEHVMTELLRKRHLAPVYGSTVLMPSADDPHVISNVPDIFHTGDLHSFALNNYRGVVMVSSSTFQGQTSFMDRVGHQSNPGKVTRIRLDNKKPSVIDFLA